MKIDVTRSPAPPLRRHIIRKQFHAEVQCLGRQSMIAIDRAKISTSRMEIRRRALLPLPACGERVGVRGPAHKMKPASLSWWTSPLTRNLREERANSDLSPQAGRGKKGTSLQRNMPPRQDGRISMRRTIVAAIMAALVLVSRRGHRPS